jgi:DNA-binding beta-propeller fold protein YncE
MGKATLCFLIPALIGLLSSNGRAAESGTPLVLERTIPLTGVAGRIDHMAIDLARKRLIVAELGNGSVDVIDLTAGHVVHRIEGLREPQGAGYAASSDTIAVANAGDGSVRLFRGSDFAPIGTISLGEDADNVRVDSRTGRVLVGYGNGGVAVLDPGTLSVLSRTKLAAHPEGFQLDGAARRVFVNVPEARQIAVVDLGTGTQIASWRIPELRANFPMALDEAGTVLATVFRDPARLVLLDTKNGSVKANLPTCDDADDVFFDGKRSRIYVSCGAGSIDVLQQDSTGYRQAGHVATMSGARTSLFVPDLDRLFVAARSASLRFGSNAAILVFQPQPS